MIDKLKIGILGGDQLGTMLIRHAIDYGLNVSVMDRDPDSPGARYTRSFKVGDPMNYDDVIDFGRNLDIITIEKETVNTHALKDLVKMGVKVYPSPDIIDIIQDRYIQKKFLETYDIPVASLIPILNKKDLSENIHRFPGCLKKCKTNHDGKSSMILHTREDIDKAFDEPCFLEELIDIKHEISVIVSRNEKGTVECYDPVMMIFNKQQMVLDFQLCPAHIPQDKAIEACKLAINTAEALNLVGILAVEMFLTTDGRLLVNELAPRPHNSGHHTVESCNTSQYEQQLRVMLGLPMGDTSLKNSSVLLNVFEPAAYRKKSIEDALKVILCSNDVHMHLYGKKEGNAGSRMGHINITEDTIENALSKATMIRHILRGSYGQH